MDPFSIVNFQSLTSIIHHLQLFQEKSDPVLNVLRRNYLVTAQAHVTSDLHFTLLRVEDSRHVEGVVAVGADDLQGGDCSIV